MAVAQEAKPAVPIMDMDLKDVVKMIRGAKGTFVTLTILRQGDSPKTFQVKIKRAKIDIKDQAAKITYETRKVNGKSLKMGIIDLPSFYGGGDGPGSRWSYRDVKDLLTQAKKEKVDGIVLDLSRNGGGLLEEAVQITGLFIQKGGVVATKEYGCLKVQVLSDDDDEVVWSGPLVVLISRLSASASEILAGALKNYHRALIVGGDHTFGKGIGSGVDESSAGSRRDESDDRDVFPSWRQVHPRHRCGLGCALSDRAGWRGYRREHFGLCPAPAENRCAFSRPKPIPQIWPSIGNRWMTFWPKS